MYGMTPEYHTENEYKSSSKNELKIDLTKVYIILLLSITFIYFYSGYQYEYLKILIPYNILWPITLIVVGLSIFKVKNTASFSIGFFITSLSVVLTIVSIFVYSSNIQNNAYTSLIQVKDTKQITSNINLVATDVKLKSANNFFKADFNSNYDKVNIKNYKDENKVENINLEYKEFPPGLGSYFKSSDIVFPRLIPTIFNIKTNLTIGKLDLSYMKLISGTLDIQNSQIDIAIKDLDISNEAKLNITSRFSNINIDISKDIKVDIINTSKFSQVDINGIEKDNSNDKLYRTEVDNEDTSDNKDKDVSNNKKLILSIQSNLSNIKITQK
jgi:hypothetical protein